MTIRAIEFPRSISKGTRGGPGFRIQRVETWGGHVHKNKPNSEPLREYDVATAVKTQALWEALLDFYWAGTDGGLYGFLYWDPSDYLVPLARGRLGATGQSSPFTASAVGSGVPVYQLFQRRTSGAFSTDAKITRPISGTVTVRRNGSPVAFGAGAGQIALDYTTGIVTFVADDSEAITGHTPGASHVFTTAADIPGLAIGEKVYLTGVTGTAAATLNALAHTISNKTGAGPYTWTLGTNTSGLTASGGTAFEYPQASDALTWQGQKNIPAEFMTEKLAPEIVSRGADGGFLYLLAPVAVREARD